MARAIWRRVAKISRRGAFSLLVALALVLPSGGAGANRTMRVPLDVCQYEHIAFDSIPATTYRTTADGLEMRVNESASFLLMSWSEAREVRLVWLRWRSTGTRNVRTAAEERTKSGDDHRLRVGLLIEGKPPRIPFFAPAWIKAVRRHLELSSNHMIYLVGGSHHEPGSMWKSPHSKSVDYFALQARPTDDGWLESAVSFDEPVRVVGLWLMADGDDTQSTFETVLGELRLE